MDIGKLLFLQSSRIRITTPKMADYTVTENGVTYTITGSDTAYNAYNIDATISNGARSVHPYTMTLSRAILIDSYHFADVATNPYQNASGGLFLYLDDVVKYSTGTINIQNATYNITPVMVNKIVTYATNSSWYANEGGYGEIRGVNFTGIVL